MSLGDKIRSARERLRLTQQELADALRVDRKSVVNWELGHTRPSRATMHALEQVLGPLSGQPDDLYTIADDIRKSRALTPWQRQVLLHMLESQPQGRHQLIPTELPDAPQAQVNHWG